ncbi:hypothetical protein ABZ379_37830 [Streptomyces canus]|uniref:hypothetical protein n=1 Tax=Streptomyces canus TaxID=58343 RepID=UPI0033CAA24C
MTEHPGFCALPTRLLDHRGLGRRDLADRAGLGEDEVRAVLAGDDPGGPGRHGAAGRDGCAPGEEHVTAAVRLPAAERRDLLRLIRALPQEERRSRFSPKPVMPLAHGPGTWGVRMLQYRNLTWSGMAATRTG